MHPSFRQVMFRRGPVFGARFAPDGHSLVFAAQWAPNLAKVYLNNGLSPESRPLGLEGSLFSISSGGELALGSFSGTTPISGADLFRAPIDWIEHTITDDAPGGGTAGRLHFGNTLTVKFTEKGESNFHCAIHPVMKRKTIVE